MFEKSDAQRVQRPEIRRLLKHVFRFFVVFFVSFFFLDAGCLRPSKGLSTQAEEALGLKRMEKGGRFLRWELGEQRPSGGWGVGGWFGGGSGEGWGGESL